MKKSKKTISVKSTDITPAQAIEFLESMRVLHEDKDEKTELISIRIPNNLLKTLKMKAKIENKKYQSIIINYIRLGLKKNI